MSSKTYEIQVIKEDGIIDILNWFHDTSLSEIQEYIINYYKQPMLFNIISKVDEPLIIEGILKKGNEKVIIIEE